MNRTLDLFSRLVTARPWVTIFALLAVTVVLAAGATLRLPPTEGADLAFLPEDHPIVRASADIEELFSVSGDVIVATIVFRGDALTPGGLSQMAALLDEMVRDPSVGPLLAPDDPVIAPSRLVAAALRTNDFASLDQARIDAVRAAPGIGPALDGLTGFDADGTPVAIGVIRLLDTGDERTKDAERRIFELAATDEGPLSVSSYSPVIVEDEYRAATEQGMPPLIGLALLLITALLLLFTRAISDVLLTLAGLALAIVWIVGAEGWLGPDGLGLIGPPSSLSSMVPVIIIGLTVDYAIQTISHYRERRVEGESVIQAVRNGLRQVSVPLALAAVTTVVSLLASLISPIGVIGDFGVVAGLGVALSLIVMLTLIPAGRTIIDRRREARGTLPPARPLSNALPGIPQASERLATWVTRWPAPFIVGVVAITVALGFAATDLVTVFHLRDLLPNDGSVVRNMKTLESAVGGATEAASVVLKAEATGNRTLLNLKDLSDAFDDESRRPEAAAGPIYASYYHHALDWIDDSGEPGDAYDPGMAALFAEASAGMGLDPALMEEFLEELIAREPELSRFMVNDPDGEDVMLLQFPAYQGVPEATSVLQEEIEELWFGDDDKITAVSVSVTARAVTNQITERQTEAIGFTVAAALGILSLFFWVTLRQPALGFVAVAPIAMVLVCVLGTMALLDIPYTLVTSIITALSIGIGVDYTIHIIHRYREEFTRLRNPERAAARTLATTGSALLGSALTTGFGFGVLMVSPLNAIQQFGLTATITIVYSMIASILLVLPAMVVWGAYRNMRLRSSIERMWNDLDVAIDEVQRRD